VKEQKRTVCKILTVDDQMGIDSFFYEFFTARNYEVFNATSGKEALKIVQKERPRIVLLDINLGRGMDGIETLKGIKELDKDAIVIMVTGIKDDDVMQKAKELGADDYIEKPVSPVILLQRVKASLAKTSTARQK
jgi:DNA-binding response OmpR family regulator